MSEFNTALATEVRDLIRLHPEQHDQAVWATEMGKNPAESCGTKACIAGWVAAAKGYTVKQAENLAEAQDEWGNGDISLWAGNQLGLTFEQREILFYELTNERALAMFDLLIARQGDVTEEELYEVEWDFAHEVGDE